MKSWDCQKCGACCTAEVWLEPGDAKIVPLQYVTTKGAMRTSVDHRCIALQGKIGESVRCLTYQARPAVCSRVQVGDPMCLFARNMHGLEGGEASDEVLRDVLSVLVPRRG